MSVLPEITMHLGQDFGGFSVTEITPLEALGLYGSFRLSAVIFSLKKRGYDIYTNLKKDMNGSVYAEYKLNRDKNTDQLDFQF